MKPPLDVAYNELGTPAHLSSDGRPVVVVSGVGGAVGAKFGASHALFCRLFLLTSIQSPPGEKSRSPQFVVWVEDSSGFALACVPKSFRRCGGVAGGAQPLCSSQTRKSVASALYCCVCGERRHTDLRCALCVTLRFPLQYFQFDFHY